MMSLDSDLKIKFPVKKRLLLIKLCFFSLHFIPVDLDPDPRTQMNLDLTGSESTPLICIIYFLMYILADMKYRLKKINIYIETRTTLDFLSRNFAGKPV